MSEDETFCLFVSGVLGLIGSISWYGTLFGGAARRTPASISIPLALCLPLFLVVLFCVLLKLAAVEVREDLAYVCLFMIVGIAWFSLTAFLLPYVGVFIRDDAVERSNTASAAAAFGLLGGTMIVFTAANIGEGPTIWTTIGPAAIGSIALLALWLLFAIPTQMTEAIAVERDLASGMRGAGLMLACGLILGRAVSGNWEGMQPMLADFARLGAPALVIAAAATGIQYLLRPTPQSPQPAIVQAGIAPAILMMAAAVLWVWQQGPW